jgi:uncharacterized protein YbjQ (UPF0145 family)
VQEFEDEREQARHVAYREMLDHAREKGADAIIGFRYDSAVISRSSSEIIAYGTAVKLDVSKLTE